MADFSRISEAEVDPLFIHRWSPRSFDSNYKISEEDLRTLFEAAKWSPSSFNDQPWTFHAAVRESSHFADFLKPLNESNQSWAKSASLLTYIVGRNSFKLNDKPNTTFEFDCGSAWMGLTLQARILDLHTHAMVGFDREKTATLLKVDQTKSKIIAAFAVGKKASKEKLPEELQNKEQMNNRKTLKEVVHFY